MNGIEKLIKLARQENGKFFILDETGEPQLVVMSIQDYEDLKSNSLFSSLTEKLSSLTEQTELLNQQITAAQKETEEGEAEIEFEMPARLNKLETESLYIEPIEED